MRIRKRSPVVPPVETTPSNSVVATYEVQERFVGPNSRRSGGKQQELVNKEAGKEDASSLRLLVDCSRANEPQVKTDTLQPKRLRRKGSASADVGDSTMRKEDGAKISGSKSQASVTPKNSNDVGVQICKRYDGRGWKCHQKALEGYSMCRHHHELIVNRLARLRNSGRLGSKKSSKKRKTTGKQAKESAPVVEADEQNGGQRRKNARARSLKSMNL